jgi:hypothetical protein
MEILRRVVERARRFDRSDVVLDETSQGWHLSGTEKTEALGGHEWRPAFDRLSRSGHLEFLERYPHRWVMRVTDRAFERFREPPSASIHPN